ncbi:MAG: flagellar basal body protein [Proteobacteria bacterium]|nr:flagellar biosynthesis protein FlgC [Desulfobulbaceae bacterium]MBU4151893.1 flagellar basal body protein [Pseudomonadota bacterium]
MISGIHSGLSALNAIQTKTQVTANNVSNVNTDGFKKSRATLVEASPQAAGVTIQIEQMATPGPMLYESTEKDDSLVEKSNVELTEELPRMLIDRRAYQANIKSIQAQDEMLGSLLDIKS